MKSFKSFAINVAILLKTNKKRGTCDPLSSTSSKCIPVTKLASCITKKIPHADSWCKILYFFFSLDYILQDLPNITPNTNLLINSSWTVGVQYPMAHQFLFLKQIQFSISQKICRNSFNFSENVAWHVNPDENLPFSVQKGLLNSNSIHLFFKISFYSG